jgi:hypothetical protein
LDRRAFLKLSALASAGVLLSRAEWLHRGSGRLVSLPVYHVPKSIPADGSTDVTRDLMKFIASVPDHSRIDFRSNGRYRIEGTVMIPDRHGLRIWGNGATLFATTMGKGGFREKQTRRHLVFLRGSDLRVRYLKIVGVNPRPGVYDSKYEGQHGIAFYGVQGGRARFCTIRNVYGDNVYIDRAIPDNRGIVPSRHIVVDGNVCRGNGRQGMTVVCGEDIVFSNNRLDLVGLTTFDLEPDVIQEWVRGVLVTGNTIGTHGAAFVAGSGRVDDVTVEKNVSSRQCLSVWAANKAVHKTNWVVRGNRSPAVYTSPWLHRFENASRVVMTGNATATNNIAVMLNHAHDVRIHDNVFEGAQAVLHTLKPGDRWYAGPSWDYVEEHNVV